MLLYVPEHLRAPFLGSLRAQYLGAAGSPQPPISKVVATVVLVVLSFAYSGAPDGGRVASD